MDSIHSKEMNHPAGRKNLKKKDNHYYTTYSPHTCQLHIYLQHKINTICMWSPARMYGVLCNNQLPYLLSVTYCYIS
jgi:hypothetical protein